MFGLEQEVHILISNGTRDLEIDQAVKLLCG